MGEETPVFSPSTRSLNMNGQTCDLVLANGGLISTLISPSKMKITETELLLAVHHTALDFHGPHCFYVKFKMVVTSPCGGLKCQCQLQGKQARSETARCCCE